MMQNIRQLKELTYFKPKPTATQYMESDDVDIMLY